MDLPIRHKDSAHFHKVLVLSNVYHHTWQCLIHQLIELIQETHLSKTTKSVHESKG
jgi:hypothetical protein